MENTKYVHVSEAITSAILERERVRPVFLRSNPDNSFTAVFDDKPEAYVPENIKKANDAIILLEAHDIAVEPNPDLPYTIHFAFTAKPTDYS